MGSLQTFRLLVISCRFPHPEAPRGSPFVKSQIDFIKKRVAKIYVIALTPYVPGYLSRFFSRSRWKRDPFVHDYKYDNVEIYYAKHIALPFEYFRKKRGKYALRAANKVIRDNNLDFDLIHAHTIFPSGYIGMELKKHSGKPLIITGHGGDVYLLPFKNSFWNRTVQNILKQTDHIITVSKSNYEKLKQLDTPYGKISIIPNGYDSNLFKKLSVKEARGILNLPPDKRIILTVGDLEPVKGHEYLIRAMKRVAMEKDNIICLIIGSGTEQKKLQGLIDKHGLNEIVELKGEKPHDQIPLWMNACDLFVLPSLNEGNPTVMFEAMGCGKPFVGTEVGGVPEIITNRKLGILLKPGNSDQLASAIMEAFDTEWDEDFILDYSKQFVWDKIADDITDIYSNFLLTR